MCVFISLYFEQPLLRRHMGIHMHLLKLTVVYTSYLHTCIKEYIKGSAKRDRKRSMLLLFSNIFLDLILLLMFYD